MIFHIRDKAGKYLSFDRDGALVASDHPTTASVVTGVPAAITTSTPADELTFTKQARALLARLYFNQGGIYAVAFVSCKAGNISLNFRKVSIQATEIRLPIDSHALAKLKADAGVYIDN